jgi:hypothetical protein
VSAASTSPVGCAGRADEQFPQPEQEKAVSAAVPDPPSQSREQRERIASLDGVLGWRVEFVVRAEPFGGRAHEGLGGEGVVAAES